MRHSLPVLDAIPLLGNAVFDACPVIDDAALDTRPVRVNTVVDTSALLADTIVGASALPADAIRDSIVRALGRASRAIVSAMSSSGGVVPFSLAPHVPAAVPRFVLVVACALDSAARRAIASQHATVSRCIRVLPAIVALPVISTLFAGAVFVTGFAAVVCRCRRR